VDLIILRNHYCVWQLFIYLLWSHCLWLACVYLYLFGWSEFYIWSIVFLVCVVNEFCVSKHHHHHHRRLTSSYHKCYIHICIYIYIHVYICILWTCYVLIRSGIISKLLLLFYIILSYIKAVDLFLSSSVVMWYYHCTYAYDSMIIDHRFTMIQQ
jgi:hypothetical protein